MEIAKDAVTARTDHRTPKFVNEMRDYFNLVGEDVGRALISLLSEIPPESYDPPSELKEPPGYAFIFHSAVLGGEIYFKFQIGGNRRKPQVLFWSCHPPIYQKADR